MLKSILSCHKSFT